MSKSAKKKPSGPPEDIVEVFYEDDAPQRSDAWFELRRGIPTASHFATVLASGRDGEASKMRTSYLRKLAGEILTGQIGETFRNDAMQRGIEMEAEALDWYEQNYFVEVHRVGFVRRTVHPPLGKPFVAGGSSDGRVPSKKKVIEVKTLRPDLLIEVAEKGAAGLPMGHRAQCQGNIWIDGADSCDLILFYRGCKNPPVFTLQRDDVYIATLIEQVEAFSFELNALVEKMRARGW